MLEERVIAMVDDDEVDILLVRRALKTLGLNHQVTAVGDGVELLGSLGLRGNDHAAELEPDLIVLDMNMPRMSGCEALAELKQSGRTSQIPVIVFTTSDDPEERRRALELGAEDFITKPLQFEGFLGVVEELHKDYLAGG
ncbi:MAG: response regulator [Acidobacteriota bacterium]|nr:response regulator [Acidobacteriota bacterium]